MAQPTPLTRTDTAWHRMDSPVNLMVVNGVMRFDAPLDRARLEAALTSGLLRYDRFRQRVEQRPGLFARPRWVDDADFHLDRHLFEETLGGPGDDDLRRAIEPHLKTPLAPDRPLWQMRLYQGYGGAGSALFFRIHHCIADGVALLRVLLAACEPVDGAAREPPRSRPRRPWYWWALLPVTGLLFGLDYLRVSGWLVLRPKDPATVFKGPLSGDKRIAWTAPQSLPDIRAMAAAAGCKINDLLMTVAAGALSRYARERGRPTGEGGVRAIVPVNVRPPAEHDALGNAFAVVTPTLSLAAHGPTRLKLIQRRMNRLKRSPEPLATLSVTRAFAFMGARLQQRLQRFLLDKGTLVITNVPGPKKPLALAGVPLAGLMFWVPMFGPIGIGISIFTYGDRVSLGVLADAELVPDAGPLAAALTAELEALRGHFLEGPGAPPPH